MKNLTNIEILTLCSMSKNQRHEYIFKNVFIPFANDCIKYNHCENGDVTCEYIASGLYTKFLDLRAKVSENDGILLDCTQTDVKAVKWVICLIRKIVNSLNFTPAGTYKTVSAMDVKGFTMDVKGPNSETVRQYTFNDIHTEGKTIIEKSVNKSTKKVDIVDVLKQWENRDSRTESRKVRQFTRWIDEDGNETSEETTIKGNYPTPEQELLNNERLLYVNKKISEIVSNCRNFGTIYAILTKEEKLTNTDSVLLSRFRKYNHLEDLTLSDLRYLFA